MRWPLSLSLLLVAALSFTACKKKPPTDSPVLQETVAPGMPGMVSVADAAAKAGFAAFLPMDTEAYIGALNLQNHSAALKGSNWAKEVDAFLEDKTPAPSAGVAGISNATSALAQLWGKDSFVALGKGAAQSLKQWQQMASINDELQYVMMMQGKLATSPGTKKPKQLEILGLLLGNEDLLRRAADAIAALQLPPLMIGVKTEKPEEVLKQLVPDALLAQAKQKAKVSAVNTKTSSFTLIEGTFGAFFTDEMKKEMLAVLPPDRPGAQALVTQTLNEVQKKTFCLAYGTANGHLVIALGQQRPDLQLATDPSKSLLSRPELAFVLPFTTKNLITIGYAQGEVLQAFQNPEPMQPIARGLLAGLKSSPMFGAMAASLEPKVKELGGLERDLQSRKLTTAAIAAWWDKGLHVEMRGGLSPEGMESKKPLKFAPAIDDPSVVLGVAYHGDPQMTAKARKLFEAWAGLLHGAGQELVKAGLGGQDGPTIAKWVESDVIPPLVSFYEGSKQVFEKGTGNEHAVIIDLGGKMPDLPFFPQSAAGTPQKMLRITSIDDVADRAALGGSWDQMQQSLNKLVSTVPWLAGQSFQEPVQNNQPGGLRSYSYQLLPGADDLLPCVAVNDTMFFMGTSISQHGEIAMRLLKAKPANENLAARWRLNFAGMRDAVKMFSTTGAAPTNADNMRSTMKWLAPLGEANGRMWIEAGNVRTTINVEVKDVVRFD